MRSLISAGEALSADRTSQNAYQVPSLSLMEAAAVMAYCVVSMEFPQEASIEVLAGAGNNGGDALALARHLWVNGWRRLRIVLHGRHETPECMAQRRSCTLLGIPVAEGPSKADLLIDGLAGVGLKGALREEEAALVRAVNGMGYGQIWSLDVPSGIGDEAYGEVVMADRVLSFGAGKRALWALGNHQFFKSEVVLNPGFPQEALPEAPLVRLHEASSYLPYPLERDDYKVSRGRVAVIAGSGEYIGAARLAAKAAQACGAGMLTVYTASRIVNLVSMDLGASVMVRPFGSLKSLDPYDAVLLGPGLGRGADAGSLVAKVCQMGARRLVIDADAIHLLPQLIRADGIYLTPHVGEWRALCGKAGHASPDDFYAALTEEARRIGATIILKAADTYICDGGHVDIVEGGFPPAGTAGSGDVLAGALTALLASGRASALDAVKLHQKAARSLWADKGWFSADELAARLRVTR